MASSTIDTTYKNNTFKNDNFTFHLYFEIIYPE